MTEKIFQVIYPHPPTEILFDKGQKWRLIVPLVAKEGKEVTVCDHETESDPPGRRGLQEALRKPPRLHHHPKTGRHYYFRPNKRGVAIDADYRHAKIKVPTLIIVGDHDESDPKMSKEMQEKIA